LVAAQFVAAVAPRGFRAGVARSPYDESQEIAQRIKPKLGKGGSVADHAPAHDPGLQYTIQYRGSEQAPTEHGHSQKDSRREPHQTVRDRKDQSAAEMSLGPRIPGGLGPTQLVLPHLAEAFLAYHVIDHVLGEHYAVSNFVNQVSDHEVVREVV